MEEVKAIGNCTKELNEKEKIEDAILTLACSYNNPDIVKYLIERGAKLDDKCILLSDAAGNGNFKVVKYIVEETIHDKKYYNEVLRWAIFCGQFKIADYMIEHGADINANVNGGIIRELIDYGLFNNIKYCISKGADITLKIMNDACRSGHLDIIAYLTKHGKYQATIKDIIGKIPEKYISKEVKMYVENVYKHEQLFDVIENDDVEAFKQLFESTF